MVVNKKLHWRVVGLLTFVGIVILAIPEDIKLISLGENYLPIHTFMEMVGMLLSFSVFIAAWATYKDLKSQKLLILSITSLAVGFFDFGHALSFSGMPDFFTPSSPTKSIYFWLAGRLTDCLAFLFLASPRFSLTNFKRWRWNSLFVVLTWTLTGYFLIIAHENELPTLYSFESGLTPLKIYF